MPELGLLYTNKTRLIGETKMKINTYTPFGIGFDQLFNEFDLRHKENSNVYPPHNVVKLTDDSYVIELAVAGFCQSELNIETVEHSLVITGEKAEKDEREYSHKGISARKFTRRFTLAEYVHVSEASLQDGILSISLDRIIPEEKKPRTIAIK
jgi:molecular chaperone IbpA